MIRQFLGKKAKIGTGIFNSYIRRKGRNYDDRVWYDDRLYNEGVSDRQTISRKKSAITAKYHYASVEMKILGHLRNNETSMNGARVLDIGSGAGHWIDFYKSLEPLEVTGLDVSLSSFQHLKEKYASDTTVGIHHGKAIEVIAKLNGEYDLVNAVGVMFHIVNDSEWEDTIGAVGRILKTDGLFVVGGHFGFLGNLNVQIDEAGHINKRLRSNRRWRKVLRKAGFRKIRRYQNNAYLSIKDSLPENNVLIATK